MTTNASTFIDCPVIIYDDNDNYLDRSYITEHDKNSMYIEIYGKLDTVNEGSRIKLLIVHSGGASEFGGVARRVTNNRRLISLHNEHSRNARNSVRHTINSPASVTSLAHGSERKIYDDPPKVVVENISATGVLLKSYSKHYRVGSIMDIDLAIDGKTVRLTCKIIREMLNADDTFGFGCKFIFTQQETVA
ncbi:MAG: PilZ domain-containing protein [Peptococcaceae bacterium]|nr:PilZ domain-containing protein [Peptococcaceae bacterium]